MSSQTYQDYLQAAIAKLQAAGVPSPEFDARELMAHLLHCGHLDIPLREEPMPDFALACDPLIQRRSQREPLQHILGEAYFGPLELAVGPGVFIPRPETEVLADWAVGQMQGIPSPRIVDLCTGTGALALYIAHYLPAQVWAVELSDAAFTYTQRNTSGSRVEAVLDDATSASTLAELNGSIDMVVTNPPYVPETDDLDPEVYQDPHEAVFGGDDGMSVIVKLVPTIARLLKPGGLVGIEHDDATSELVQDALRDHGGFADIAVLKDLTGTARFVTARRVSESPAG